MERKGGYTPLTPEQREQRQSDVFKRLEAQIAAITTSESFQQYLKIQSRFHSYSWRNVALIMSQMPEASRVAGVKRWNEFGRFVKKGEHGLDILAPVFPKGTRKEEEDKVGPSGYMPVKVFDVSQTHGKDLPEHNVPVLESEQGGWLYPRLTHVGLKHDMLVMEADRLPGAAGIWRPGDRTILIAQQLDGRPASTLQKTKSLAHELGHGLNDHGGKHDHATRSEQETVAEGTAFVALDHFGLDSGERSFPYIAAFAKDTALLKKVLGIIQRTSRTIIDDVEGLDLPEQAQPAETSGRVSHTLSKAATSSHGFYGFPGESKFSISMHTGRQH